MFRFDARKGNQMWNTASKWGIFLKAFPYVISVLAARYLVQHVLEIKVAFNFGDISSILTATTLIVALMLTGVLADYKESEKIPTTIARSLDAFDGAAWRGLDVVGQDGHWARVRVYNIAEAVNSWLTGQCDDATMWKAQRDGSNIILEVEKQGAPFHYIQRMMEVNSNLGSALARIQVIRDTSYIAPGYALMELLVGAIMVMMTFIQFPAPYIEWPIAGALTLLYAYLVLLVKDVDDPFEYGVDGQNTSAADVDLSPFLRLMEDLRAVHGVQVDEAVEAH